MLRKNLNRTPLGGKTANEGYVSSTTRETLQELAGVVLVLIPEEALLSYLKLLSQRDYLLQSVLITTKCFQLLDTELELENQNSLRSLWFGWKKEIRARTYIHIHSRNYFVNSHCSGSLGKIKGLYLKQHKTRSMHTWNIIHENALEIRSDFQHQENIFFRKMATPEEDYSG